MHIGALDRPDPSILICPLLSSLLQKVSDGLSECLAALSSSLHALSFAQQPSFEAAVSGTKSSSLYGKQTEAEKLVRPCDYDGRRHIRTSLNIKSVLCLGTFWDTQNSRWSDGRVPLSSLALVGVVHMLVWFVSVSVFQWHLRHITHQYSHSRNHTLAM